jgi:hypothetical protein
MIKFWIYLDIIALLLITLRKDGKDFYQTMILDLKNKFVFQWLSFVLFAIIYLPFSIPFSLAKIINDYK